MNTGKEEQTYNFYIILSTWEIKRINWTPSTNNYGLKFNNGENIIIAIFTLKNAP